jgi:hypothetical protein
MRSPALAVKRRELLRKIYSPFADLDKDGQQNMDLARSGRGVGGLPPALRQRGKGVHETAGCKYQSLASRSRNTQEKKQKKKKKDLTKSYSPSGICSGT